MSYFRADEQMEQADTMLPAPWGLRGVARRAGNTVELELDWQRPRVSLDGFRVLASSDEEGEIVEIASVAGSATHCRATLPLDSATTDLSVVVVARRGMLTSPPSAALRLSLAPLPLPVVRAEAPPAPLIAPAPLVSEPAPAPAIELVDDLGAIDAALNQAQAHLGTNGVFVRFKKQA